MKILIFILVLFCSLFPFYVRAQDQDLPPLQPNPSPVVVELFSSIGCPACPPADEFMKDLAQMDGVIALSCHVDYFNVPDDRLAQSFCTDRQTDYITQIKRKSHFTPQAMINGHISEIGYEREKIAAHIVKGRAERVEKILITPKNSGVYGVTIPAKQIAHPAALWLAVYRKPVTKSHRGRSVTYYQVVSHLLPLGSWNGGQQNSAVYPLVTEDSAGFAIFAQDPKTGRILAASDFRL